MKKGFEMSDSWDMDPDDLEPWDSWDMGYKRDRVSFRRWLAWFWRKR